MRYVRSELVNHFRLVKCTTTPNGQRGILSLIRDQNQMTAISGP
jgi:hypothetical protein